MSGALMQLAAGETYENKMERRLTYVGVLLFASICAFWLWRLSK
jgi:hypothetical protein